MLGGGGVDWAGGRGGDGWMFLLEVCLLSRLEGGEWRYGWIRAVGRHRSITWMLGFRRVVVAEW